MANLFAKAKAAAEQPETKKGKKENIVTVEDVEVGKAIVEFCKAAADVKQAEADKKLASGIAEPHCLKLYIQAFAATGRKPETTKYRDPESGKQVTLILQDRSGTAQTSTEQIETLKTLLGEKKAASLLQEDTVFSFNNSLLEKDGVADAIQAAVDKMVKDKILTSAERDQIIKATPRTIIRKGVLEDLADIANKDPDTMEAVIEALGSNTTHYIKP